MEPVLRALGCYLLLLVVVRLSGKRGLAQVTIFDFIATALGQAIQYVLDSFKDRSDRSRDHENF